MYDLGYKISELKKSIRKIVTSIAKQPLYFSDFSLKLSDFKMGF